MSDTPKNVAPERCGWCDQPASTEVITAPGRKKRKTAPVCEEHAADFERRGIPTVRSELDERLERERKRGQWRVVRK